MNKSKLLSVVLLIGLLFGLSFALVSADEGLGDPWTEINWGGGIVAYRNVSTETLTLRVEGGSGVMRDFGLWDNSGKLSNVGIKHIVIEDRVKNIGNYAFSNNQLIGVDIGNSVTSIGKNAFSNNQLTSVIIGNGVTSISSFAFSNNQLTSVVIPDSVTNIELGAFSDNQLTSVEIGDSVTSIGGYAFRNNQLTSVVIPDSVTSIGSYALYNNKLTSVDIGNTVTNIGSYAFESNKLTSVVIPNSVTSIGERAFYDNQLISIDIGNSVTSIGVSAFLSNELTSVVLPASITSIGNSAFRYNKLVSVVINRTETTNLGGYAFADQYDQDWGNSVTGTGLIQHTLSTPQSSEISGVWTLDRDAGVWNRSDLNPPTDLNIVAELQDAENVSFERPVKIKATANKQATWEITIKDPQGNIVATIEHTGTELNKTWSPNQYTINNGEYTVIIKAQADSQQIEKIETFNVYNYPVKNNAVNITIQGMQGTVRASIENLGSNAKSPMLIVQVKDENGYVVFIGIAQMEGLQAGQSINLGTGTSFNTGEYIVEVFVWDGWDSKNPLSEKLVEGFMMQ